MAWSTVRILQKLSSHRVQRQSLGSTPEGSGGQRPERIGILESESGKQLSTDGFPSASKGLHLEHLFSKWLQDRSSIHGTWQRFFRDLVENKAPPSFNYTPSEMSDSKVKSGSTSPPPGQAETLPQPSKSGLVLPAKGLMSKKSKKMTRGMSQEKTPREPENADKGNLNVSPRRTRRPHKYSLLCKFAKFRRQASAAQRNDKSLHKAQKIPGSKAGSRKSYKFATFNFKNYYEEQRNREKAKQSKLRRAGVKDIAKETTITQEKPQPDQSQPGKSHLGKDHHTLNYSEEDSQSGDKDPSPRPKTRTYESLEALIDDLDNATINMAFPDPIHQERVKRVQLWSNGGALNLGKVPSEKITLADCQTLTKNQTEKRAKIEDKTRKDTSSAKPTKGAENPSKKPAEAPLGNVSDESAINKHPSSDP